LEKLNNGKMKRTVLFLLLLAIFTTACDAPQKKEKQKELSLNESILQQEEKVFNDDQNRVNRQEAMALVNLYEEYATQNPDDSLSPEYLFRASDISMNLGRPGQTIRLFNRILTKYPDFKKAPSTLFLMAFVYEDQIKDYDNAKKYYELFLSKYPDSEFADDAEISLKNLGKSPEELIREFEENK
jgi:tetratricopeptide (TPR) repeat protein